MKKILFLFSLFFIFLSFNIQKVEAFSLKTGDSVFINKNEIVNGNLYVLGKNISINGTVLGDIICAGQNIDIQAKVEGDIICAGQSLKINGDIEGDLRIIGNNINIGSWVEKNATIFGSSIIVNPTTNIEKDLFIFGELLDFHGKLDGDLHGAANKAKIQGEINKNIIIKTHNLEINSEALIGENINYTSNQEIKIDENAIVIGEIKQNLPPKKDINYKDEIYKIKIFGFIISIFSYLVIGLIIITLFKNQILQINKKIEDNTLSAIVWGFTLTFITPVIIILLIMTIIGIPLSLILLALWLIGVYVSKIFFSIFLGIFILNKTYPKKKINLPLSLILGIFILKIIVSIKIIGVIFYFVSTLWMIGKIFLFYKK